MSEGRHRSSFRRLPPALLIVPVALVALGVAGFLVLRGGNGGPGGPGGPNNSIPKFHFTLVKTLAIPTNGTRAAKLAGSATAAAHQATKTLTELYTEAFLDPANWRDGVYRQVWPLFDGQAAAAAQGSIQTLTAGTTAGSTFDAIQPANAKLSFKVLMDDKGMPSTIVGIVHFSANATRKDGRLTALVSVGQYFLHATPSGWRIFSYEVNREDHVKAPTPGPSVTPTAAPS